ncbi:hypothetical protein F2Q68_00026031 [Brassica cretica]|uniref:Uncharacterized protein n=1 Tax=Brassica cretica TaxID=69181 RepID=A0A8S9IGZ1_BRACR|nr:hypothetical protein F2Q68_00026031 [Brassica cretica]
MWESGVSPLDPEIVSGPIGLVGTRRFLQTLRSNKDPEVPSDPEVVFRTRRSYLGPRGRLGTRRLLWTRRSLGNTEVPLDPEVVLNPKLYKNLEVYLFQALRSFQDPETAWGPEGTVLRLPRKSLTGLEGVGVGVMTQLPGLRCFPRLEKQDLDCSMYFKRSGLFEAWLRFSSSDWTGRTGDRGTGGTGRPLSMSFSRCCILPLVSRPLSTFVYKFVNFQTDRSLLDPEAMWESGVSPLDPEIVSGPIGLVGTRRLLWTRRSLGNTEVPLDPKVVLNPELYKNLEVYLFQALRSFQDPETAWGPEGTVLRLPRQDYSWYLFGFRILPVGSWPLSSSYAVFYFCRKSLTGLEGVGVGVMTQLPGLRCFPRLEKQDLDCSMYFTVLLQ